MTLKRAGRPIEILLVEDNPGDVRLIQEAFKDAKILNNVHVVADGVDALAFLRREGEYAEAVYPDLILLDLNLPKKNGYEVLAEVKADPSLKRTPVVVLTISKVEEDVLKAHNLHANCYVVKPLDLDQFLEVVRAIEDFWMSVAKLPPDGTRGKWTTAL